MKTIVLDPGHGGSDPGAVNHDHHLNESDMTLDVCRRAKELLEKYDGLRVIMTREDDSFVSLTDRVRIANSHQTDAFVSYHFNSASNPNVPLSFEGFTTPGETEADKLATSILQRHAKGFPDQTPRFGMTDGDPDKEASFYVLRKTHAPAFLMEGEFIHTDHGARFIGDTTNRQRMARAAAYGILDFLGIKAGQATANTPPAVGEADMPKQIDLEKLRAHAKTITTNAQAILSLTD